MKKIILIMMLVLSVSSFSWEYKSTYNYNLEKDIQLIGTYNGEDLFSLMMIDKTWLTIGVHFKEAIGSTLKTKVFVDKVKIYDGTSIHSGNGVYLTDVTRDMVGKFKRGKNAVIVMNDGRNTKLIKCSLMGFTKSFNKIKNVKYLNE